MATRISEIYKIKSEDLESQGVFDCFVDVDSPLHVDPHLLSSSKATELSSARPRFDKYFQDTVAIIKSDLAEDSTRFKSRVVRRLTFPEQPLTFLGYSGEGKPGRGIGPETAARLADTSYAIVKRGFESAVLFELLGLLEDGVGADQISDMTIQIILPELCIFSRRVAANLFLDLIEVKDLGKLPLNPHSKQPVLFFPKDILRNLPTANDWSGVDYVCEYNTEVRTKVNQIIGDNYREATTSNKDIKLSERKKNLKDVVLQYPEVIRDLAQKYQRKPAKPYDFETDPAGAHTWSTFGPQSVAQFGSQVSIQSISSLEDVMKLVLELCNRFKDHCENKGYWKNFYYPVSPGRTKLHHEAYMQRAFYSLAYEICKVNGLDISPEVDAGSGPVDFKFSIGIAIRVLVELKKSSSSSFVKNYQNQLSAYAGANDTDKVIFLILRTKDSTANIDTVTELRRKAESEGKLAPSLVVVDIRHQESASKLEDFDTEDE